MIVSRQPRCAWGDPPVTGTIRTRPEDFRVEEILGFEPDGDGEHLWLRTEKTGENTEYVARCLSKAAGVHPRAVGYAGMKDRDAVTRQWFSLQLPGSADPDWRQWIIPGVKILEAARSMRKIRRGGLKGNRFELVVRGLEGDLDALESRLETVRDSGAPNAFGEQRFGGNNIARAHRMFRGELKRPPSRVKRGVYLSAARSLIFNRVLTERIGQGTWNRLIPGDRAMLDGTRSHFAADSADAGQIRRCAELDIHPTGPLPGLGEAPVSGEAAALEDAFYEREAELTEGLRRFGVEHHRRALRVRAAELEWSLSKDRLALSFRLGAGSYATAVLRELVSY